MTLAEFFLAVTNAGVRLANLRGQIQLRGRPDSITAEIRSGAAEHKEVLLALLPPTDDAPPEEAQTPWPDGSTEGERHSNGGRNPWERPHPDWRDWRLEWLLEVGVLYLRLRDCQDQDVVTRLRPLSLATPGSIEEWLALGRRIADAEAELRDRGRLPAYPWPGGGSA